MISSSGTLASPRGAPDKGTGVPPGPTAKDVSSAPTGHKLLVVSAFLAATICLIGAYFWPRTPVSAKFGLFWLAMIILVAAVMWVLFVGCFSDRARLVTLATASVITYLPKLFRSYRRPAYLDELLHLGQAHLLQQGVLIGHNSQDPTGGYFPLYQLLVVTAHDVTRLSLWDSDLLVAGLGHVAIVLAVYLLARQVTMAGAARSIGHAHPHSDETGRECALGASLPDHAPPGMSGQQVGGALGHFARHGMLPRPFQSVADRSRGHRSGVW